VIAPLDLYCAVDILDGGAVRLTKGDFGVRTDHGDPVELALRYVRSGARLLHVVDLDAARDGKSMNRAAVLRIVEKAGVPVQVGGGARTVADVTALLDSGVARVVISTLAVDDPVLVNELAERFPGRLALGLDHRPRSSPDAGGQKDGTQKDTSQMVAVRGWEQSAELSVETVLDRFRGAPLGAVVATSIERDGMLSGPDTTAVTRILAGSPHPVIASGGVRSVADLVGLARVSIAQPDGVIHRLAGVVVGRALADGSLDVKEAIAACER
jgi:phosphoribosylformimino-5-aminoimidazole carboxamide ribotide isomerase